MTMGPKRPIKFDLRSPCADCPFLEATPVHPGVAVDLPSIMGGMEMGTLAHTCHKTDPLSDSPEGQAFNGPLQHCAGALILMEKSEQRSHHMTGAIIRGDYSPALLNMAAGVSTVRQFIAKHLRWAEKELGKKKGRVSRRDLL